MAVGKKSKARIGNRRLGLREQKRVALIIESSNSYARNLLHGIVRYIREQEPWSFVLVEQSRGEPPPLWLEKWNGDGIIARIENTRIANAVTASGKPAVDLSAGRLVPALPWVETNDDAIGKLAFEHFAERGFRRFAYIGDSKFTWSRQRGEAFRSKVEMSGFELIVRDERSRGVEREPDLAALMDWVRSLPKPIAIFGCYDILGRRIIEASRQAGLSVPEEVAVLGVDNDELLCELSSPPLSSVVTNPRLAGYQAAAILDAKMDGRRDYDLENLIEPLGIATRQSSDVLAVDDPQVALALRYIREHACTPISVVDVLRVIPLSRRVLEMRFKKVLGSTPHREILQARLGKIKQLLAETDFSNEEIAARTGFEHPEYMGVAFKREQGMTPSEFRRKAKKRSIPL